MISRGLVQRRLRQVHYILGAVIGAQVFLWFASGLFMVAFDLDEVHGDHLRADQGAAWLPDAGIIAPEIAMSVAGGAANEARLTMLLGEPVWIVTVGDSQVVVSAQSGALYDPPTEEAIRMIAERAYQGRGELLSVTLLEEAPRHAGAVGPIWEAEFGPKDRASLYLDPLTGDPGRIRTPLWHTFDFMWGLHIMDWSTRENFNSWWIKATAFFAVLFSISGLALVGTRLLRRRSAA